MEGTALQRCADKQRLGSVQFPADSPWLVSVSVASLSWHYQDVPP